MTKVDQSSGGRGVFDFLKKTPNNDKAEAEKIAERKELLVADVGQDCLIKASIIATQLENCSSFFNGQGLRPENELEKAKDEHLKDLISLSDIVLAREGLESGFVGNPGFIQVNFPGSTRMYHGQENNYLATNDIVEWVDQQGNPTTRPTEEQPVLIVKVPISRNTNQDREAKTISKGKIMLLDRDVEPKEISEILRKEITNKYIA